MGILHDMVEGICMDGVYNTVEKLKEMYDSDYSVKRTR